MNNNSGKQNKQPLAVFQMNNSLIRKRLAVYLPLRILTDLSAFIVIKIDGIVAGNYLGADALAVTGVFASIYLIAAAVSKVLTSGILSFTSNTLGKNNAEALNTVRCATLNLKILLSLAYGIVQIPLTFLVVFSFGLSPEMEIMAWQYAIGTMLAFPLTFWNEAGTREAQAVGKIYFTTVAAVLQCVVNLVFDILLMGFCNMGIAGAGYSTLLAVAFRFVILYVYLYRRTDVLKVRRVKCGAQMKAILKSGLPVGSNYLLNALTMWLMAWCISRVFGVSGIAANEVCLCAYSIAGVFTGSNAQTLMQLVGMYNGSGNKEASHLLMQTALRVELVLAGAAALLFFAFPQLLYVLYGYTGIGDMQIGMMRIICFYIVLGGLVQLFQSYFSGTLKNMTAIVVCTLEQGVILIPAALFFCFVTGGLAVVWSYVVPAAVSALTCFIIYFRECRRDKENAAQEQQAALYLSVKPEQSVELSEIVHDYLEAAGMDRSQAYKTALFIEEIVNLTRSGHGGRKPNIDIMIRRGYEGGMEFMSWDDGAPMELTGYIEQNPEAVMSGFVVRSVADKISCTRIMDLNFIRIAY